LRYAERMIGLDESEGALRASALGSAAFEGFCRVFFSCYCPLVVEGQHYLPDGPFLLCSNHASHADSAALMTASGRTFRTFALLGASDYFFQSSSVRKLVAPFMNVIPIERCPGSKSLTASITMCRQFLERTGGGLILYPEGTRSFDGQMRDFKAGISLFVRELALPLVPAYIEGTHQILPKGSSVPRPGRLTVRFGRALAFPSLSGGESVRSQKRAVVEELVRSIRMLQWAAGNQADAQGTRNSSAERDAHRSGSRLSPDRQGSRSVMT
jgi:1-acyl-sn-glycerol-3-phosphate acyltransferase